MRYRETKDCFLLTCHTPQACRNDELTAANDTVTARFPYASLQEQAWLKPDPNLLQNGKHCQKFPKLHPALEEPLPWCRGGGDEGLNITSPFSVANRRHGNPVLFHNGCVFSPYDRMYVFPQHKLAFCGIPKVGVTQWLKFLRYSFGAVDFQGKPYYKFDLEAYAFAKLPRHRQVEILTDPSWTKAVFWREPSERLLSAYLDKIVGEAHRRPQFRNFSFGDFVHDLETKPEPRCSGQVGPSWCWDPHWRPQSYSCGQHELLDHYDFVGSMDDAAAQTKTLLKHVGMWDDYGAPYTTTRHKKNPRSMGCASPPMDPSKLGDRYIISKGFQQDVRAKSDGHTRNSKSKMEQYFEGTDLQEVVQRLYSQDYRLWNALQQHQDQQRAFNTTVWTSGRDLARLLNPDQCEK